MNMSKTKSQSRYPSGNHWRNARHVQPTAKAGGGTGIFQVKGGQTMTVYGIILGTGAPVQSSKFGKTKCAIILADQLGFIRVYPVPAQFSFPVWGRVSCDIEKSQTDNRPETFKILPGFDVDGKIDNPDEKRAILNDCCLRSGGKDPIDYQNELRRSIALVQLDYGNIGVRLDERVPDVLDDDPEFGYIRTQSSHFNKPYLSWESIQGKRHDTHLLGMEVYEGLRNNPEAPWNVFTNMRVNNPDYERWLLLGNMRDRRNVWVGVHLHRLKKSTGDSTPAFFNLRSGKPEGWPYSQQELANAKAADAQLEMFTTDFMTLNDCLGSMQTVS